MAKQTTDKSVRKLTKLGGKSIGLTLPIELVRDLGIKTHLFNPIEFDGFK